METLGRLTRRQVDALQMIARAERPGTGVSLKLIASSMKVRPPSALGHLTLLEEMGLVVRHRGKSRLTSRGQSTLMEYQRHHRVAETLFSQLGLSPAATCAAAREVDLSISHKTVEEVCAAEGHPSVCPHGEPITPCSTRKAGA
ncbi:MAG: metal-dependent transcriptional regulator [Thermoplasmata archaeon]|nr:metal-dependent transcriptional regulator [Thermoplasmata archaeon]